MKRHQRGHVEVEYGDLKPDVKMWTGVAICGVGFVMLVLSIGWLASCGIALAMWGYKLQTDGAAELERERASGVALPAEGRDA